VAISLSSASGDDVEQLVGGNVLQPKLGVRNRRGSLVGTTRALRDVQLLRIVVTDAPWVPRRFSWLVSAWCPRARIPCALLASMSSLWWPRRAACAARFGYGVMRAVGEPTIWAKYGKPWNRCLFRLSPTRPTHP